MMCASRPIAARAVAGSRMGLREDSRLHPVPHDGLESPAPRKRTGGDARRGGHGFYSVARWMACKCAFSLAEAASVEDLGALDGH